MGRPVTRAGGSCAVLWDAKNSQRADEGGKGWRKKHTGGNRREVGPCSCLKTLLQTRTLSGSDLRTLCDGSQQDHEEQ